jgi:hypothetical protein
MFAIEIRIRGNQSLDSNSSRGQGTMKNLMVKFGWVLASSPAMR